MSNNNNDIYKRIKCCGKHTMNSMIFRWKITFHSAVSECSSNSSNSIIVEFIQRTAVCARRRRKIVSCCFFCVLSKLCLCHNCAPYRPDNKYPQTKLIEFAFCEQLSQLVGAKAVYRTSILERKRQKGAASTCYLVSIELAHRFSAFVSAVPSSARLLAHRRSIR